MLCGIHTECVHTHIDILGIAVYQIIVNLGVFGFKIKTVVCDRLDLGVIRIEVASSAEAVVMIDVVRNHFLRPA